MSRRRLNRWVPAVAAPLLVAAAVVAVPAIANAAQPLPPKSPSQVLQLVADSSTSAFSGTVSQTSDLGLPSLPTTGAGSDSQTASALELLTGTHDAQVWVDGRTKERIAVLDSMAERDVVRNGDTVWTWDSKQHTASETTLTSRQHAPAPTMTPAEAASMFLTTVGSSTTVTVDRDTTVAGRGAYTLVLTPKTDATTVGSVRIAVDAATGLPLQVQVFARGAASPAFQVGFTALTIGTPAASEFDFTPPSGANVQRHASTSGPPKGSGPALPARPTVTGSDWSSVVTVPAADVPAGLAANPTVERLSQPVAGGRVLVTSLVTVLLTTDGRVLAGAVPASTLESLAAQH